MVPVSMTFSDLDWLNETFNDTNYRAFSVRQLSFLLPLSWTSLTVQCIRLFEQISVTYLLIHLRVTWTVSHTTLCTNLVVENMEKSFRFRFCVFWPTSIIKHELG